VTIFSILRALNPVGFLGKPVTYSLKKPRLSVYHDPDDDKLVTSDPGCTEARDNFIHVMVRNDGRDAARNCTGELWSIQELKGARFQNIPAYKQAATLRWADSKDFSAKEMASTPLRLEICCVREGQDTLHFSTENASRDNQTVFPPGTYKIRIRIKGARLQMVTNEFIVKYNASEFNSLQIKESKEPMETWTGPQHAVFH